MFYILPLQAITTMGSPLFGPQNLAREPPFKRINTHRKIKVSLEHVS